MKKILPKLIASILALTVSASLVAMSSYAWFTMSGAPEVGGIQVNIGGSNTIMVAPDVMVQGENGMVYHYPGAFSQNLDFSRQQVYAYVDSLAGLVPVSTADGLNWIVPDYYDQDDELVRDGRVVDGQIKNPTEFLVDNRLQYANLPDGENNDNGSYIYVDFWVVSPSDTYKLRVSTGDKTENSGSYVISLMEPKATDEDDGYVLEEADQTVASIVRIGFLANQDWASSQNVQHYVSSADYNSDYEYLIGCYQEPGDLLEWYSAAQNRFTIYEPNGTMHPDSNSMDYHITKPLGVANGVIAEMDISDRLTVQTNNRWKFVAETGSMLLGQVFQAAMLNVQLQSMSEDEVYHYFYWDRLQMVLMPYLERGQFIKNTQALYAMATDGVVPAASIHIPAQLRGATEDVYITTLRQNIPQRIRMFIWLEGQDVDCKNSEASSFAVNIELAGGE